MRRGTRSPVYCQPPRPAGRGQKETPCPVHRAALELGLPVRTPARVRRDTAEHAAFAALELDAAIVAAYGLILPREMLEAPKLGCLNIHASLLPRWRGAGPIQAAILAGDTESGITIMRMDEGLDTGPMLLHGAVPIGPRTTTPELHDALAAIGARWFCARWEQPAPVPQPENGVTYAPKLGKEDGRLTGPRRRSAGPPRTGPEPLARHLFPPWRGHPARPGSRARCRPGRPRHSAGRPPRWWPAANGALRLLKLQRAGRAAMPAEAFLRGYALPPGACWAECRATHFSRI
jgi:methionyl-tRNA formyltransferase